MDNSTLLNHYILKKRWETFMLTQLVHEVFLYHICSRLFLNPFLSMSFIAVHFSSILIKCWLVPKKIRRWHDSYFFFQFLLYCTAKLKSGWTCLQMYLRTFLGLYLVLHQTSAAAASQQHLLLLVFDCILFDRGVIELHERVASATQRISAAIGNEKSHPLTSKIDPKKSEQIVRSKPTNHHHF